MTSFEPERGIGVDAADIGPENTITDISSGIIPHKDFPSKRWLYSGDTLWYYHAPKRGLAPQRIYNEDFYETIDPCIQELMRYLHTKGIYTTPSCQGHFYEEDHYAAVWDKLEREADPIRTSGLPVRDDETGEVLLAHDPHYRLPWDDFVSFYAQASRHQTVGYVGFILPDAAPQPLEKALGELQGVTLRQGEAEAGGKLVHVFVSTPGMADQCQMWSRVTAAIEEEI